jgi:hypothetical protein
MRRVLGFALLVLAVLLVLSLGLADEVKMGGGIGGGNGGGR